MTDGNGQEHILDAVERLLAGETVDLEGMADDEQRRLLEIARDLRDGRPQPSADYEAEMEKKIMQSATGIESYIEAGNVKSAGTEKQDRRSGRFLPSWLTLKRVATVYAVLVLGLGVAGLTGAVFSGRDVDGTPDSGRVSGIAATDEQKAATMETEAAEDMRLDQDAEAVAGSPDVGGATAGSPADAAVASGDTSGATTGTIPTVRQVIRSADYEIEVAGGEFQEKYSRITEIATEFGGYVVSADTKASDEEGAINSGTITIRIADIDGNFEKAMSQLDELGKVVSRDVSGDDVTEEFVDLQSRLRNAQAHEASLLGLMDRATTVEEMLMVQNELNAVRAEIEQLQGQINYIESRSDFATITVELHEEDAVTDDGDDDDGIVWGFTDALEYSGWLAVQTVNFVIMALGVIIPVTLILLLVTAVVYKVVMHRRS